MKYIGQERRKTIRCMKVFDADFIFFSDLIVPDSPRCCRGVVRNFSVSGLCVDIDGISSGEVDGMRAEAIKLGAKFNFFGDDRIFKALGRVVWLKPKQMSGNGYIMGVEFVDITAYCQELLESYIVEYYIEEHSSEQ